MLVYQWFMYDVLVLMLCLVVVVFVYTYSLISYVSDKKTELKCILQKCTKTVADIHWFGYNSGCKIMLTKLKNLCYQWLWYVCMFSLYYVWCNKKEMQKVVMLGMFRFPFFFFFYVIIRYRLLLCRWNKTKVHMKRLYMHTGDKQLHIMQKRIRTWTKNINAD